MKNRFVKSGLDLEAKMNELDQKVEKKEEFKNELATLDEMLDKVGAELLTVKDGLRLIENGKHELKTTCDTIAGFVGETERMVEAFHDGLEEMMTATYQNEWTKESKESLNRILALYSNLVKNYLDGFCNDEKKAQEDFLIVAQWDMVYRKGVLLAACPVLYQFCHLNRNDCPVHNG